MPNDTMAWRSVTQADFESLREIYDDAIAWLFEVKGITDQWHRPLPEGEIQSLIDSQEAYLVLVACDVAGAVKLSAKHEIPWEDRQDQALYAHSLAVMRKFSGRGVGTTMLEWAGTLARKSGKRFLRLDCMAENPRLRRYYSEAGFRDLGQHPQHTWHALFEKEIE